MSYTQPTADEIAARRAALAPFDGWNERAFCQIVAWMGIPQSYLDLGSGTGAMVNCARKLGSDAYGVDLINGPEHWFVHEDLTRPMYIYESIRDEHIIWTNGIGKHDADGPFKMFDLITCMEVAEHLPLESHETLVDTIARHLRPKPNMLDASGYVLFSAAPPGQRGEHHVGCRPAHEWRGMFHERGISYREDLTRQIAHLFGYVTGPASHWLASNLQVFDTGLR
jgi:SAM-dependent methyltransferase